MYLLSAETELIVLPTVQDTDHIHGDGTIDPARASTM